MAAGRIARSAARRRGGGSALPGLVAERVDPDILTHALAGVPQVVVVTGTNGKTTTTKMLVALLRAHGREVFTNPTGSNFTRGVISAMLPALDRQGRMHADLAVLELDEAHALHFVKKVAPTHALLLNVARDQLDRFAEIDHTARLLHSLAAATTQGVVLNRDDPYVARIADDPDVPPARYFGLDESVLERLAELQEADVRFEDEAPTPDLGAQDVLLRPRDEREFELVLGDGSASGPIVLRQRGLAAMINATAAVSTARLLLGEAFDPAVAGAALREVAPPFGRGEVVDAGGRPLELVLVKNPAGFTVALGTYGATPVTTMVAINDRDADGRDVSWLYDVSFASLRENGVALTSGIRAYDMALRLRYDDVEVGGVEPDLAVALDRLLADHPDRPLRVFCTYTAMMTLRRILADRYTLPEFGEDAPA